jgi:hypothetical protein
MSKHRVTIKDFTAWTATVDAHDATHAEELAWKLFHNAGDRAEHFEEDSDTTVQVEEVIS